MVLALILAAGSVYAFQKAQIWWYKSKDEHCRAKLDDRQKELDDLKAQVQQLTKERNTAQSQANTAWSIYAKQERERKAEQASVQAELDALRGTYNCDLPDSVRKLWDRKNRGSEAGRHKGESGTAPPDVVRSAPVAVAVR